MSSCGIGLGNQYGTNKLSFLVSDGNDLQQQDCI